MRRPRRSPWLGHQREVAGQAFDVVAVETVFSRRGLAIPVLVWATTCRECSAGYTFVTARKPADAALQPRCREHTLTPRRVRRLRRLGIPVPTPGLADLLVTALPDGRLASLEELTAEVGLASAATFHLDTDQEADHGR